MGGLKGREELKPIWRWVGFFFPLFFSLLFAACDHKPIGISGSVGPEDVPAAWEG